VVILLTRLEGVEESPTTLGRTVISLTVTAGKKSPMIFYSGKYYN
jgi:hypothetical protein